MIVDDDFTLIVPHIGDPIIVRPGDDISDLVGTRMVTQRRTVALNDGKRVSGTIYVAREVTKDDEIAIELLINEFLGYK